MQDLGCRAPLLFERSLSSAATVNEGGQVTFTLATTNVASGSVYNFLLSGTNITSTDVVGSLTGTVTIGADGIAYIPVSIAADLATEGAETLTLNLAARTASVTINDT